MTAYTMTLFLLILQANGVVIPWYVWVLLFLHPVLRVLIKNKEVSK